MSEQQVNSTPQEEPKQKTVTAESVLLSAVELAQSRGAYKVNEMALITEAHRIVTAQEEAKKKTAEGESPVDSSTSQAEMEQAD